MPKKKVESHVAGKVMGVAAVAAAAFGTYLLYGAPDASKNRKLVKSWALKMKGDVLEKIEDAKEVTEEKYHHIIEEVLSKYKAAQNIDPHELGEIGEELKGHWHAIKKQFEEGKNQ